MNSIFSKNIFKNSCKLSNFESSIDDVIPNEQFIDMMNKLHENWPLLYFPRFIEDFINGVSDNTIIIDYDLNNSDNLNKKIKKILNLNCNRQKGGNSKSINLKNNMWNSIYHALCFQCNKFKIPLKFIYFNDLIISFITFYYFQKNHIPKLNNFNLYVKSNLKLLPTRNSNMITQNFCTYLNQISENDFKIIIHQLHDLPYTLKNSRDNISANILNILNHDGELQYHKLYTKLIRKHIIFKYVRSHIWMDPIIEQLVESKQILRCNGYAKARPHRDVLRQIVQ
ncbi:MAG: hypothetical protein K8823_810 [Cenarchaeum symbiont of Oopsacas minuta]|nr:hypothetical protein [Cenarchaeum symbiont of Oopsacas minuta]